jgi:hypothetical protein
MKEHSAWWRIRIRHDRDEMVGWVEELPPQLAGHTWKLVPTDTTFMHLTTLK